MFKYGIFLIGGEVIKIDQLFYEDVREKKRIGSGAFHKRGKGVRQGMRGIKMPYDFMKTKERNKLNGECVVSNMYDAIITREEFEQKDDETKKRLLTKWRELYSNKEIMQGMGITAAGTFAKYINELKIPKKSKIKKSNFIAPSKQEQVVKLLNTGLHLEYSGSYNSDQINKILTKLQLLIEGEENNFTINISITEQ